MNREQTTIRLPAEAAGVWTGKTVKALHYLFERCVMRVKAVFGVTQIIPNELHVGLDVGDVFLHLCLSSFQITDVFAQIGDAFAQIGDVRLHLHEDPEDFFFVVHGAAPPFNGLILSQCGGDSQ